MLDCLRFASTHFTILVGACLGRINSSLEICSQGTIAVNAAWFK